MQQTRRCYVSTANELLLDAKHVLSDGDLLREVRWMNAPGTRKGPDCESADHFEERVAALAL